MLAHYFTIIETVLVEYESATAATRATDTTSAQAARACKQQSSSPAASSTDAAIAETAMFTSPRKRPRQNVALNKDGPVTYRSVHDLHTAETELTDALALQAHVLHYPSETRLVMVRDRRTGTQESVSVMSILLADRTGPILLEFWREAADETLHQLTTWETGLPCGKLLMVDVQRFVVREDSRIHSTSMRKLHSNEHTTVKRLTVASCQSMNSETIAPAISLYTRNFNLLSAQQPPFVLSIAGIISNVQGEAVSQNGAPMKAFKLQDNTGKYVQCVAFGRHVDNPIISENTEVVLYFAQALAGRGNYTGQLWLYDESHVSMLRSECAAPSARQHIELRQVSGKEATRN